MRDGKVSFLQRRRAHGTGRSGEVVNSVVNAVVNFVVRFESQRALVGGNFPDIPRSGGMDGKGEGVERRASRHTPATARL
jgi:hypothetical protein